MDLLDDQLTPEELAAILEETEIPSPESQEQVLAIAFTQAFETRFASRLDNSLAHGEGRE
jgi:hypothetical protein